jgi:hypothetical protein
VGLALLATDWAEDDIPLIQTIGLLSNSFGALAAEALQRRRGGGEALLWLAQRVAGWGRVYVVEALCRAGGHTSRGWLLRHACDGDFLDGYFAGQVATAAHLHEAITGTDVDDDLIDHTGRLLKTMADCAGMGTTLEHYPPAPIVLARRPLTLPGRRRQRVGTSTPRSSPTIWRPSPRTDADAPPSSATASCSSTSQYSSSPTGATRSARGSTRPANSLSGSPATSQRGCICAPSPTWQTVMNDEPCRQAAPDRAGASR